MTFATWSVHFGVVHAQVADRWNYLFFEHVGENHKLAPLVTPLTLGAAHAVNIGSMLLANRVPGAISSIVSNVTPDCIERLTHRYEHQIKSQVHFPTMIGLMGINPDDVDIPIINTLGEWWRILEKFVRGFIGALYPSDDGINRDRFDDDDRGLRKFLNVIDCGREWSESDSQLESALTMMHFNNVIHQLYSNDQHTTDAMAMKHTWVCHKVIAYSCTVVYTSSSFLAFENPPHGYRNATVSQECVVPSLLVQDRLIELLIGTSGDSLHYNEEMFALLPLDAEVMPAVTEFLADLKKFSIKISANPDKYVRYLHPDHVTCAITW
ncbi:hypothetical protein CYMTET_9780 [Cymbomonas tetramitiformis]|uniref:Uncharacterized protein n=1 Tax=Cymbomonas tetramitiformis TaxID=36881 RepID=A0AAE0GQG4_9CHLO|nr:hypothetical protein CYMTET_9780 [Cymbomonas tetramitiformis]